MKKGWWLMFDGLERDFEEFWTEYAKHKGWGPKDEKVAIEKQRIWGKISRWIDEYSRLLSAVIPGHHIACRVESMQQYRDFSAEDLQHVIEKLGELSHFMYSAGRDIFFFRYGRTENSQLVKYWISVLQTVVWLNGTFIRPEGSGNNFTSFLVRWKELSNEGEADSLSGWPPTSETIMVNRDDVVVENGVVYYREKDDGPE